MTDFDAASARLRGKTFATAAMISVLGFALAGCETAGSLFGDGASASSQPAPVPAAQKPSAVARVAMAPVVGAPDGVAQQLSSQMAQAAEKNRLQIVTSADRPDYTLRGYVVAARDKAGTKVSYIWDVTDGSGKRVNRITGEEVVAGTPNARDPWANVAAPVTQSIAEKTASSLGAWAPGQTPASPAVADASAPAAAVQPAAPGAGVPPTAAGGKAAATAQAARAPASTNTTTAAVPPAGGDVAAVVPQVQGAPGDGNAALSSALQRELSRQGIALVDKPGTSYRVEGKVVVGEAKDGKQPIQIDWRVKDPQGRSLGTVSQNNEIPPGSLDSSWGKTADAAAAAAAQGILKLLPQAKSTN